MTPAGRHQLVTAETSGKNGSNPRWLKFHRRRAADTPNPAPASSRIELALEGAANVRLQSGTRNKYRLICAPSAESDHARDRRLGVRVPLAAFSGAGQVWPRSPPAVARVAALGCEVPANSQFRCSALLDHLRMLTLPA
jgi:hypothetical protein